MNAVARHDPFDDPATLGYPPTLPLEVALKTAPIRKICESYGITKDEWEALCRNEGFKAEVRTYLDELKKEGVSFRMKARLQSEELLKTSWRLIHSTNDQVPPNVKADLIKFTVRAAGLDGSKDQAQNNNQNNFQININLG